MAQASSPAMADLRAAGAAYAAGRTAEAITLMQKGLALLNQGKRDQAAQEAATARKLGIPQHPLFEQLGVR